MPAKDHAVWDIVSDNPLRWWLSETRRRRNAAARTAFLDGPEANRRPERVHASLQARLRPGLTSRSHLPWMLPVAMSLLMTLLAVSALASLWMSYKRGGTPNAYHLLPLCQIVIGVLFAAFACPAFVKSRAWRRALDDHCPDCNYDLSSSHPQPPLDPNTLGLNLGPRRCPECGALWPLVPPEPPPQR